ncbi:hypothetical protein LSAT2_025694 [Lamellibrachia satsuma]|nr:hypothetical protein LSAT2_025694 [Lamellibrachia satsuma]
MNDQLDVKVSRAKEINKPHVSKGTSSAAINLMAEHRISYRKRRSFKLDVIPTTFSASNVRRTPKTKSRQTTVISKTKRAASKAAVTLEKLVRDKTLCKDIRKLSTQYQTSSIAIEPSTASIALLSTLLQSTIWQTGKILQNICSYSSTH